MSKKRVHKKQGVSFEVVCLAVALCVLGGAGLLVARSNSSQKAALTGAPTVEEAVVYGLPQPTALLSTSKFHSYPVLKGIKINPDDPFTLEFIIDTEDEESVSEEEVARLIRYFLAGLTIPEDDLWVNLSPYEEDRIIPEKLGLTDLGKDLLSQDYVLKQLVSSLVYPESHTGKKYWGTTYKRVYQLASTTNIPINTFNKVWIVPERAEVYENKNVALITEAKLKVLSEEDYLAMMNADLHNENKKEEINKVASKIIKESILPEVAWDVNHGENFARLRQIYNSFILAVWFKKRLGDSIFQYYIDQGKIQGIDLEDKSVKEKIYNLYVEAYKKGVYDYIKKDYDQADRTHINRRYYSGGIQVAGEFGNKFADEKLVLHSHRGLVLESDKKVAASIELDTVGKSAASPIREIDSKNALPSAEERQQKGLNAITIDAVPSQTGFGDVMNAFRLAEGLRRSGEIDTVRLLFESADDLQKLRGIMPDVPANVAELQYFERDGIVFINGEQVDIDSIIGNSKVAIVSLLMIDEKRNIARRTGRVNIYLQEFDCSDDVTRRFDHRDSDVAKVYGSFPLNQSDILEVNQLLEENRLTRDADGNLHIVLPTGFSSDLGIHIAEDQDNSAVATNKTEIIQRLSASKGVALSPQIAQGRWGLAYYTAYEDYRQNFERHLISAVQAKKVKPEGIYIFDTSSMIADIDAFEELDAWGRGEFTHIFFDQESGQLRIVAGKEYPQIRVIHVETIPHDIFLSLLQAADLPVLITGDASLSETIAFDKLFIYQIAPHKTNVMPSYLKLALRLLDSEEAELILKMHGFLTEADFKLGVLKADRFQDFGERLSLFFESLPSSESEKSPSRASMELQDTQLWDFYSANREILRKVLSEFEETGHWWDDDSADVKEVRRQLIEAGVPNDSLLLDDLHIRAYANIIKALPSERNDDQERFLLRKHIFFDLYLDHWRVLNEFLPRIFWDADYQNALHKMNQRIREERNLTSNLVQRVSELVERVDTEQPITPIAYRQTGGIALTNESLNLNVKEGDAQFDLPLVTIRRFQNNSGLMIKAVRIKGNIAVSSFLGIEEKELSYQP